MNWPRLVVLCMMTLAPQAVEAKESLRDILQGVDKVRLGCDIDTLKSTIPGLSTAPIRQPGRESLVASTSDSLFATRAFNFQNGKLHTIMFSAGMDMNGGWETAERVVADGKNAVEEMTRLWGDPEGSSASAKSKFGQLAYLHWNKDDRHIFAYFSTPESLLSQAGQARNPVGHFMVSIGTSPDIMGSTFQRMWRAPYTPSMLDASLEDYKAKMAVTEVQATTKYFPDSLQPVFFGMRMEKLKGRVKADNFFGRNMFFAQSSDELFPSVNYRARMDRLLVAELGFNPEDSSHTTNFPKLVEWCEQHWSLPAAGYERTHLVAGKKLKQRIFVWSLKDASAILRVGLEPKKYAAATLLHGSVSLDEWLNPEESKFEQSVISGEALRSSWAELKSF